MKKNYDVITMILMTSGFNHLQDDVWEPESDQEEQELSDDDLRVCIYYTAPLEVMSQKNLLSVVHIFYANRMEHRLN